MAAPARDAVHRANRAFALGLAAYALWGVTSDLGVLVDVLDQDTTLTGPGYGGLVFDVLLSLTLAFAAIRNWSRRARTGTKLFALAPAVGLLVVAVWLSTETPAFALIWSGPVILLIAASIVLDPRAGGGQLTAQDNRLRSSARTDGADYTLQDIEEYMGGQPVTKQAEQPEVPPSAAEAARRRLWK